MYSHKNDLKLVRVLKEKKTPKLIYYQVFISLLAFYPLGFRFSGFSSQTTQLEMLKHFYIRAENPPEPQGCRKKKKIKLL